MDFSISSGRFSVRIETNSQRVDKDNVQDQDPSLTIRNIVRHSISFEFLGGWSWILASALVLLSIYLSSVIRELKRTLTSRVF